MATCAPSFQQAALRDGVELRSCWNDPRLTYRAPEDLPPAAGPAIDVLRRILRTLGADQSCLATVPARRIENDLFHDASGTWIEVDEQQHFTRARRQTLHAYPAGASLGFDLEEYIALCDQHWQKAEKDYGHRTAKCFPGELSRARQRAYYDAVRDLAGPALGLPMVLRVPAVARDGEAAWRSAWPQLRPLLA